MPVPVVFIPAMLCDGAMYDGVFAAMGAAIVPKIMMSPKPDMAASVAEILSGAPPKFALAGTSYGGALALEVAIAAPERVSHLWVMGADGDAAAAQPGFAEMVETDLEAVIGMLSGAITAPENGHTKQAFQEMARRVGGAAGAAEVRAMAARPAVWGRMDRLTMPCLCLWGAADAITPVAAGRKLAEALPHAHFYALPRCGHLPALEQPAETAAIALEFLKEDHGHHGH